MSIKQKVSEVNQVFDQLGAEIAAFQSTSQLSCVAGCGKCCQKPDINASVLEFLPLAYALYQEGRADEVYDEMTQLGADDFCHFFRPVNKEANQGYCGSYQQRGLICRLFGFSARKDKNGLPTMITCKVIKEGQAEKYQETDRAIKSKELAIPNSAEFYMQLYSIDFALAQEQMPINEAIKRALEIVLTYYSYGGEEAV